MTYALILFLFSAIGWACNNQAGQPEEYSSPAIEARAQTDQPSTGPAEWQVDVIWQGMKIVGGGPFPAVDTIFLYMEDANVSVFSRNRPTLEDVKRQAKPPVMGYSLLGIQGKPRRVSTTPQTE